MTSCKPVSFLRRTLPYGVTPGQYFFAANRMKAVYVNKAIWKQVAGTVLAPVTNRGFSKHFTETRRLWTSVAGWDEERKSNFCYSSQTFLAGRWFQFERRSPTSGYHSYLYENDHQCQSKHNVTSKNNRRKHHLRLTKLSHACHKTRIVMTQTSFQQSFKKPTGLFFISPCQLLRKLGKYSLHWYHIASSKIYELWHSTFQQRSR